MTITAKYTSRCAVCHGEIAPGVKIEWSKGAPVRHAACAGAPVTAAPRYARTFARRSGAGSAARVPGYSSYCTDRAGCDCFDCR